MVTMQRHLTRCGNHQIRRRSYMLSVDNTQDTRYNFPEIKGTRFTFMRNSHFFKILELVNLPIKFEHGNRRVGIRRV